MTVALLAFPQFTDNSGNPLSGGKVLTYAAGTLTPLATYTDRGGLTANSNPVILDSAGRADIWLSTNVAYKLILQDAVGNPLDSVDNYYAGADPAQLVAAGIVPATGGTYTGLVSFTGGATFDGTATQDLATLDSLGIASVQNSNLWINSDFSVWQRFSSTAADATYGLDRTVSLCESGSVGLAQLAQPEDGTPYAMRTLQPDAAPKRIGFSQVVEAKNCIPFRGKNLNFTVRLRSSVAVTVRVALVAWTGAADGPTADVVNNWASTTYTAGNFFVASTSTIAVVAGVLPANTFTDVTVSSTSAGGIVAPSSMTNLYMVVWTDTAVAQNVTLDAARPRCGLGSSAQIWTPPDAATELNRCLRYYATSYESQPAGTASAITGRIVVISTGTGVGELSMSVFPKVAMRTPPNVNVYNPTSGAAGSVQDENAGTPIAAGPALGVGKQYFRVVNSAVLGGANRVMAMHYTAYAEL